MFGMMGIGVVLRAIPHLVDDDTRIPISHPMPA